MVHDADGTIRPHASAPKRRACDYTFYAVDSMELFTKGLIPLRLPTSIMRRFVVNDNSGSRKFCDFSQEELMLFSTVESPVLGTILTRRFEAVNKIL